MFIVKVSYFSISRINNCQEIRENGGFFDCWGGGSKRMESSLGDHNF